ncbi:MAG: dipeptidase [Anaerolineae bacterium]|nr:dipeptidase [Anaerolineae bacterium]
MIPGESPPIIIDALQCSNWDRELFEELRAGGVSCVHVTCAVWEGARATLENLSQWYRYFRDHSDLLRPVYSGRDIQTAVEQGQTGVILGFQNSSPLEGDLGLVEVFHRLGVRVIQLTYNNQSLLGAGCYEASDAGLTRFGREVIGEMNRLGIIVDLSHVGPQTTLDAIQFSQRPVAVTHANPASFHPIKRNKSDEVLIALAQNGGVLGCSLYPHLIGGREVTRQAFCEMIARTVDLMGIDHVGIGSDSVRKCTQDDLNYLRMGRWTRTVDYGPGRADQAGWPEWQSWFQSPLDFPNLVAGLRAVGFSEAETAKIMGENWLRFFSQGFEPY